MAYIYDKYKWISYDLADQRVLGWPLMSSPVNVVLIIATYLYVVKIYLPDFMKNRPPYNLKNVINAYNVFQVVANAYLFHGLLTSGWTTTYHLGCLAVDYSNDAEAVRMAKFMHLTTMLKVVELIETVFFVLRKKFNQASFLHIYHHVITITVMWLSIRYVAGGMASLTPLINTFVHVIMYSYYLISSIADTELKKKLNKWKIWLTITQMIQFTILLVHILQAFAPSCPVPKVMAWIYLTNLLLVYYLFFRFFRNAYFKKPKDGKNL